MDKELSQLNYELILDAYTRHLEEEPELIKKTKAWLDKRHDFETVISSLIYKDKVWERDDD